MTTVSADVTKQMAQWADRQVKKGVYKSKSELIREMFRDRMTKDRFSEWSEKALAKAWKDEDDKYWESYL